MSVAEDTLVIVQLKTYKGSRDPIPEPRVGEFVDDHVR